MSQSGYIQEIMRIRTPTELGALIREHRKARGLDQAELAKKIGVSRKWIIGIEQGRSRAELRLVLRALDALGIDLNLVPRTGRTPASSIPVADIDAIVASARKSKQ